jgi:vacuolar-type H+-ATPase subunit E/Vma4
VAAILGDPEALVAEVSRRAHHRAVAIAEEAGRRATAILDGAKQESDSIRRQSGEAAGRQLAALVRRNTARAELEGQRRFILFREVPIDRIWHAAEEQLRGLVQQPIYRDVLKRCALRAASELGGSELVLAADPVGHQLLSTEVLDQWSKEAGVRFRRAQEPAATWGGLLAASGRFRFDATFPTLWAMAQVTLREKVFQILSQEAP